MKLVGSHEAREGGGGGYSGFSVTGMIELRQNQNPPKFLGLQTKPKKGPGPKFNPIPSPPQNKYVGTIRTLQIVLKPKETPTYIKVPKKCKIFLPNKSQKLKKYKIKILTPSLSLKIWSSPPPSPGGFSSYG